MKKCKWCEIQKEEVHFYRNHDECKKCWNEYNSKRRRVKKEKDPNFLEKSRLRLRQWREKNPDKQKEYTKRSLEKNKEKINERRRCPQRRKAILQSVQNWRLKNPERFKEKAKENREKNKLHGRARNLVYKYVSRGKMIRPLICKKCLKECKPEAHHEDYEKPLEIHWLCKTCHNHRHSKLLDVRP